MDGEGGAYLEDDERSLLSLSLSNNSNLILQRKIEEDIEQSITLRLTFVVHLEKENDETRRSRNQTHFNIEVSAFVTVHHLKQMVIEMIQHIDEYKSRQWRIRRVNFMYEMLAVIQDETKTLFESEIYNEDTLCLEEGRIPVPGELAVYIQVHQPPLLTRPEGCNETPLYVDLINSQCELFVANVLERTAAEIEAEHGPDTTLDPSSVPSSSSSSSSSSSLDATLAQETDVPPFDPYNHPTLIEKRAELMSRQPPPPLLVYSPAMYRFVSLLLTSLLISLVLSFFPLLFGLRETN